MTRLRSLLFAPATRPDLLRKLPRSGPDAVVIDCEDATPPARKQEGRENASTIGAELAADGTTVFVRVNGVDSAWFDDDLATGVPDGGAGIVVPMVDASVHLDTVAARLRERRGQALKVIAGIETAQGVAAARTLLAHRVVDAAYFGAEDFVADMGGVRTASNQEVLLARSELALAGRLAEVPVLDQVVVEYGDRSRFEREAAEARAMGYAGKLCIHPDQVALAHAAFTPSESEVATARALIAAFEAAQRDGIGVIVVDGRMIDGPLVAQARRVVAAAG